MASSRCGYSNSRKRPFATGNFGQTRKFPGDFQFLDESGFMRIGLTSLTAISYPNAPPLSAQSLKAPRL
jgi:hypothetical protein